MKCRLFKSFFFLLLFQKASPQRAFENIGVADGLSTEKVADIIQDREGFYWIATADGLNRFDGSTFKVFRFDKNDTTSLSHNNCTSLVEDDNGDIWVGTVQGINRFIKKEGIFKRFYFHQNGINDNLLNCAMALVKDNKGNIWAATAGLWKINSSTDEFKGYLFNHKNNNSISDGSQCLKLSYDTKQNGLWIATSYQLNFFNIKEEEFYHHNYNPHQWPVFTWPNKWPWFTTDKKGNTWLYDSHEKKLHLFKPGSDEYDFRSLSFQHPIASFITDHNDNLSFSMELQYAIIYNWVTKKSDTLSYSIREPEAATNYKINEYYADPDNNVWLCTANGLFVSKNSEKRYKVYSFGTNSFGLPVSINGMVTRYGIAWLGIENKLYEFDFKEKRPHLVFTYPSTDGFRPLFNDGDSLLWLVVENKVVVFDFFKRKIRSETSLQGNPYFLVRTNSNIFWAGTWDAGFYKLDSKANIQRHYNVANGLKSNSLISCAYNNDKSIWFGFNGGAGFTRFDLASETFENFEINEPQKKSPQINSINAITSDKLDNLWLGTHGGGIFYFDRKKNTFVNFSVQDGLSGDYINSVTIDGKENLWISTSQGIDILNTRTRNIFNLNESMKFGSHDHLHNIARAGTDSFVFFAVNKALLIKTDLYQEAYSSPSILVSSFKVFDKEYPEAWKITSLKLPHNKNFFTIIFSVLKTSPAIPANYKYKLDGFDQNWNNAGNRGIANYTNVPPGKYRLLLNGTDELGRWKNEPQIILITIIPPFWRKWWFISIVSIVIISALYSFYRYRITQVKKLYLLRSKISQDLHDEVGATLSSIHVYSSVAAKTMNADFGKAQDALDQINANTRQVMENMNDIVWAMYTGSKGEISFENKLKNYGYELLTPLNISCTYDIDNDAEKRLTNIEARKNILLIAKEAINNIAKHSNATQTSIHLKITGKDLQLEIIDNGKGFGDKRNGNGFQNMKSRTEVLGGHFTFLSKPSEGTRITCSIPITNIRD